MARLSLGSAQADVLPPPGQDSWPGRPRGALQAGIHPSQRSSKASVRPALLQLLFKSPSSSFPNASA